MIIEKEMKKMSTIAASNTLKMHKRHLKEEMKSNTISSFHLYKRRRLVVAYESLIYGIEKLNWIVDMEFAEGDYFKRERYLDRMSRIENLKDHISWLKAR